MSPDATAPDPFTSPAKPIAARIVGTFAALSMLLREGRGAIRSGYGQKPPALFHRLLWGSRGRRLLVVAVILLPVVGWFSERFASQMIDGGLSQLMQDAGVSQLLIAFLTRVLNMLTTFWFYPPVLAGIYFGWRARRLLNEDRRLEELLVLPIGSDVLVSSCVRSALLLGIMLHLSEFLLEPCLRLLMDSPADLAWDDILLKSSLGTVFLTERIESGWGNGSVAGAVMLANGALLAEICCRLLYILDHAETMLLVVGAMVRFGTIPGLLITKCVGVLPSIGLLLLLVSVVAIRPDVPQIALGLYLDLFCRPLLILLRILIIFIVAGWLHRRLTSGIDVQGAA